MKNYELNSKKYGKIIFSYCPSPEEFANTNWTDMNDSQIFEYILKRSKIDDSSTFDADTIKLRKISKKERIDFMGSFLKCSYAFEMNRKKNFRENLLLAEEKMEIQKSKNHTSFTSNSDILFPPPHFSLIDKQNEIVESLKNSNENDEINNKISTKLSIIAIIIGLLSLIGSLVFNILTYSLSKNSSSESSELMKKELDELQNQNTILQNLYNFEVSKNDKLDMYFKELQKEIQNNKKQGN